MKSPFRVGSLITTVDQLYGRQVELSTLNELLVGLQNHVHLVGERKIGKTSLIRTFMTVAETARTPKLCVYSDVSRFVCDTWADFYRSVVEAAHAQLTSYDSAAADRVRPDITRLGETHRAAEVVGVFNSYFRALRREGISTVLFLDELGMALRHFGNEPMHFNHLRYVAQSRDQYDVTVATCDRRMWNEIAPEAGGSPGLNFINQTLRLRAISEGEVSRLLREATEHSSSKVEFSEADVAGILQYSGGVPYLVQLFGERVFLLKTHGRSIEWPELAEDVYGAIKADLVEQLRVCTEREKTVLRRQVRSRLGREDGDVAGVSSLTGRGILVPDGQGGYRCYSPLFERVCREQDFGEEGRRKAHGSDAALLLHHRDDVNEVVSKLRGTKTVEAVEEWLLNFAADDERRLALKLLKSVRYFDLQATRQWCGALHGRLGRELGEAFYRALFITFGGPAKSGAAVARYYYAATGVDAKRFRSEREVGSTSCKGTYILLDDFIGSGSQITKYWERMNPASQRSEWVCAALLGYKAGIERIRSATGIRVIVNEVLDDSDKVFSPESTIFDHAEKATARLILESYGNRLYPGHPLGYEDGQALIAFYDSVPNNTLPVIWSERAGWKPIYRRHGG